MRVAHSTEESSKPRGSRRRTLAGCGAALLLLALIPVAYLVWANTPPAIPPDTRVYPTPNGYDRLRAAAMKLTASEGDSPLAKAAEGDPEALRRALAADPAQRAALEEVRQALKLDAMTPPSTGFEELYPHLARYREAARRFAAESRVADHDGNSNRAAQSAINAVELGSRSSPGGGIIHHLVAVACASIGVAALEGMESDLSADEARRAGERLDRVMAQFSRAPDMFREEKRSALTGLAQVFSGKVALNPGAPTAGSSTESRGWFLFFYPKPLSYAAISSGFDRMAAEAEKPYVQRVPIEPPTEMFASLLMPVFQEAGLALTRGETSVALARGALALREFRQRRGRYPESLAELGQVTGVSLAPDPFTGQPLRYRRTNGDYLLYSVGPDGVDDGGRPLAVRDTKKEARGDLLWGSLYPPRK
ncbi:MAG: hypothetical protein ACK47B_19900 [Armatimonadota bacterium]